jgi:hypothetical protein
MSLAAIALLGVVMRGFWGARKIKLKDDPPNEPNRDALYGGGPHA